ncbi:hypothetical protein [Nocardia arizonensis]|uniref:hypothetical protein n=1 Tax=Nocardia arizonensis TaxID=1141647 RepID=UPI0006D26420|nr:hypothetical protein [Nocardia arizonensis]
MSTVGEYFDSTIIRGIHEGIGTPGVVQAMHGTPRDGALELMTGTAGAAGDAGPAGYPFRWEGDIADQSALNALAGGLGLAHAGKAWRVVSTNALMYWNGTSFDSFAEAFGGMGPDGQPCSIAIGTVDTGPVGSPLQVTVTGTPPNLTLSLTVPRGVKGLTGEDGPPGPLRQAADYADGTHVDNAVPVWNDVTQKWTPAAYPGLRGPWSIVEETAWDGGAGFSASQTNVATSPNTIAQLNIPAQDTAWRPVLSGGVAVRTTEASSSFSTRVDAEVRIGSNSGQLVGIGIGWPFGLENYNRFRPCFGARITDPTGSVGVIAAGTAVTLYVVLRRGQGSSNYTYNRTGAQLVCWAQPVAAS